MDLEALLRAARDGQPGAMKALLQSLNRELRQYFLREFDEASAVELTQLTMEKVIRQLPGFVPRKSLRGWVFGVARNQGRLERRARSQDNKALGVLAALVMKTPNTSPSAERMYAQEELIALLLEELEKLPSRLRRVINHDLENAELATPDRVRSHQEFARQEGIQLGTVRSRRLQAVKMLRDRLTARLNRPLLNRQLPSPPAMDSSSSSSSPPV